MSNIFFISDHHLGHESILTFKNYDGSMVRDFKTVDDMHDYIITNHNKVVSPKDKVYFLGDVVINRSGFNIINELNGHKRLIMGNHDIFDINEYIKYFDKIGSYQVFPDDFICSHIPLAKNCITERFCYNVHGHLHNNVVKDDNGLEDESYYNVCCERLGFTPVEYQELKKILNSPFRKN